MYGDDIGLSTARARRAMEAVSEQMGLTAEQAEHEGRGYVQSDDVVNAGFVEADTSRVQVQVVYDELAVLDDYEGVEITPITREVRTADPFGLNLMRITVDGKPIDDPGKRSSDIQRCTDVALEKANIEFKFDNLKLEPRLNVTAWPRAIRYQDLRGDGLAENLVRFRMYTNYRSFIERAEVRIFEEEQSARDTPVAVIEMDADGMAEWQAAFESVRGAAARAEVRAARLRQGWAFRRNEHASRCGWSTRSDPSAAGYGSPERELLAATARAGSPCRTSRCAAAPCKSTARRFPQDTRCGWPASRCPWTSKGTFVAEEILPAGLHTVEVAVLDHAGNGELFLRDLSLQEERLVLRRHRRPHPFRQQDHRPGGDCWPRTDPRYNDDVSADGRLAFYTNGKFGNGWELTASADTLEGPVEDLFSNFLDKSPDALFRRIDPDYHYPTYGDDGTVGKMRRPWASSTSS